MTMKMTWRKRIINLFDFSYSNIYLLRTKKITKFHWVVAIDFELSKAWFRVKWILVSCGLFACSSEYYWLSNAKIKVLNEMIRERNKKFSYNSQKIFAFNISTSVASFACWKIAKHTNQTSCASNAFLKLFRILKQNHQCIQQRTLHCRCTFNLESKNVFVYCLLFSELALQINISNLFRIY